MTVAELIAEKLHAHRCRHIFAISGAGNMFLFDAIDRHPDLEYVCPHHEQAGAMAAVAYTRMSDTGALGVMMTTAGPGAINAVTGLLNGWADSIPMIMISGQEKSASINVGRKLRMWGVQGFDVVRTVSPFCKYAVMITDPQSAGYHLDRAVYEATHGRPGPVWIDVPMDVQSAVVDLAQQQVFTPPVEEAADHSAVAAQVHAMLAGAKRPVFILGNGIRLAGGKHLIPKLLEQYQIPVITAWSGMDMVPSTTPNFFGHAGVYGGRSANFIVQNSDLLVCIGTRLAIPQVGYDLTEYARDARKVVVDVDAHELAKFSPAMDFPIQADARQFMDALLAVGVGTQPVAVPEWLRRCTDWKQRYPLIEPEHHVNAPHAINTYRFIDELNSHLEPQDLVVADAGAAHTCTQQVIHLKPGMKFIATTGLGEMGYGLPGAIGASFAQPGRRVVLITGDGSMMMNLQELQTIVHHQLPIKIFLYDNDGYLTIRNTQNALFKGRQAGSGAKTGVTCPDFLKVAAAFGIPTCIINDFDEAPAGIEKTLSGEGPCICVVYTDPQQIFVPKLSISTSADGALVSPPLEDLAPLIPREQLAKEMIVGVHPKSVQLGVPSAEPVEK
jgi:acetolactate synthase-1/2/3 large subunit